MMKAEQFNVLTLLHKLFLIKNFNIYQTSLLPHLYLDFERFIENIKQTKVCVYAWYAIKNIAMNILFKTLEKSNPSIKSRF